MNYSNNNRKILQKPPKTLIVFFNLKHVYGEVNFSLQQAMKAQTLNARTQLLPRWEGGPLPIARENVWILGTL
jgi:hypothetical protein